MCLICYGISTEVTQHFLAKCFSLHDVKITCFTKSEKNPKQKTPGCVFEKKLWKIHQYLQLQWQLLLCEQSGMKAAFPWIPYPFVPTLLHPHFIETPSSSFLCSSLLKISHPSVHPAKATQQSSLLATFPKTPAEQKAQEYSHCRAGWCGLARTANPPSLDLPSLISQNFEELDVTKSSWHLSDLVQADQGVQRH